MSFLLHRFDLCRLKKIGSSTSVLEALSVRLKRAGRGTALVCASNMFSFTLYSANKQMMSPSTAV